MNRKMLGFLSIASIFGSDASHYNESDSASKLIAFDDL